MKASIKNAAIPLLHTIVKGESISFSAFMVSAAPAAIARGRLRLGWAVSRNKADVAG